MMNKKLFDTPQLRGIRQETLRLLCVTPQTKGAKSVSLLSLYRRYKMGKIVDEDELRRLENLATYTARGWAFDPPESGDIRKAGRPRKTA